MSSPEEMRRGGGPRILILGAGCTGLGAAWRLRELGHENFLVLEQNSYPGGLAASFVDGQGFTWDLGGHVQFSHYPYFDRLMDRALGQTWGEHIRRCYIWAQKKFIPYPFQNNLRHLPAEELARCLQGLLAAQHQRQGAPGNFREWILHSFGEGIADLFLLPYNFKVWAHPAETMDYRWVGERVATVDVERVIDNVVLGRDDSGWGPNLRFRFPTRGGTGAVWRAVADLVGDSFIRYRIRIVGIEAGRRMVVTASGERYPYDVLISSLPLDVMAGLLGKARLVQAAQALQYTTTHVIGIGVAGQPPEHLARTSWMYFPEDDCPFYRVTVFSNYSPANVPDPRSCWSLLAEVSESRFRPVRRAGLRRAVIQGLLSTHLLRYPDQIVSLWHRRLERGYPVPALGRDQRLEYLLAELEKLSIYSRGRFGAWKYEVGNQDHSCMQGVEAADRVLLGQPELTVLQPQRVNAVARPEGGAAKMASPLPDKRERPCA
ncbi:MAG: protoporphyrinogen/coproporphyrinogen oxidase [Chlamydiota bacterium]